MLITNVADLFGPRRLVKMRGVMDDRPFDGTLMAQADHAQPSGQAQLRNAIGFEVGDIIQLRIDERIN